MNLIVGRYRLQMNTETGDEYRIDTDSTSYSIIERWKVTVTNGKLDFVK